MALRRYVVDMLPQSDLPFVEEHFVASERQVLNPCWGGESRAWRHLRSRPRPTHVRSAGHLAA